VAALPAQPLLLDLGPSVASAGFSTHDHEAVIAELAELVDGAPERAVAKRRAEFLAGRWAARAALSALGVDATPGRNEDGSPRWPEHTVGSITHGAERALCAVARSSDVRSLGIDAERLMSHTASAELRARICAADELAILREALQQPEHHGVTFAFSAKESLYKCLHPLVKRFMDFSAAHVVSASAHTDRELVVGELDLELRVDWSAEFSRGRVFRAQFLASAGHVESAVLLPA
jgi:enterobactin synthetase component D